MALTTLPDNDFRLQYLDLWNDYIHTVPEMLYNTVKHHGDRPANVYWEHEEWQTVTYKEMLSIAEEIAAGLIGMGVARGDNLSIMAPSTAQWVWSDMGIELAGGCTTTIFPSLGKEDVKYIINHSRVNYLFAGSPELVDFVNSFRQDLPTLKGLICLQGMESGNGQDVFTLDEIRAVGRKLLSDQPEVVSERIAAITPEDGATTIYTSGTTGKLKAVRLTHRELTDGIWRCNRNQTMGEVGYYDDESVYLSVMPLAHVMERTYGLFCVIACGACLVLGRGPAHIMNDLQEIKPTNVTVVPRVLDRILKGLKQAFSVTPEGAQAWAWAMDVAGRVVEARTKEDGTIDMRAEFVDDLPEGLRAEYLKAKAAVFDKVTGALGGRIECFGAGGANLLPELHKPLVGMGIFVANGYGLTETLCGVAVGRGNCVKVAWNAPIAPGLEWRLDADGELLLKGKGVISEYYNDPEANQECFTEDGFFRTGDIVEIDKNGIFRVVDRKKAIIVMDTGKNVSPLKVEALVMRNILIDQVLVVGDGRKYITALINPNWDEIIKIADAKGIPYDKDKLQYGMVNGMNVVVEVGPELYQADFVRQIVAEAVNKANEELADFEQIKKFVVPHRKFLQTYDELTPTSKVKNKVIMANFATEIESLYQ